MERAIDEGVPAITDDADLVCHAGNVEAVIEATGTIEYGAHVALQAVTHGKHTVLGNVELDATVGPILKAYADSAGVLISNSDGDEPGVAMNMLRFVRSIGLKPVVTGNLKGLYDPYRTPETQKAFRRGEQSKSHHHDLVCRRYQIVYGVDGAGQCDGLSGWQARHVRAVSWIMSTTARPITWIAC